MELQPAKREYACDEDKAEGAAGSGGGKERGVFGLAAVNDCLETKTAAVTGGAAGGVIANQGADWGEGGSDAQTGKKIRERRGDTQAEDFLKLGGAVEAE